MSVSSERADKPSARLVVVALTLALCNAAAVAVPFEMYPFTSSPMFAHPPVGTGMRYRVTVEVLSGGSGAAAFPYAAIGFTETHFARTLLTQGYGSADADAPYGFVRDDSDAARTRRLEAFFRACVDALRERDSLPLSATGIRLSLQTVDREAPAHEIGTYDLASRVFRRPGVSP